MLHHPTSPVVGKDKVKGEKPKGLKLRQKEKKNHKELIEKQVKIVISAKDSSSYIFMVLSQGNSDTKI